MNILKTNLEETIEKHDSLNPKLFNDDNLLIEKVRSKMLEIVDVFLDSLAEDNIKIILKDILLIGSNASYNYTKDSDIDLHIVADTKSLHCPDNLYPTLYSAYRSLFNKKYDISIYDIPVEIYVETEDVKTKSNGIYSVKNNEWVKEPELLDIPEVNQKELDTQIDIWTKRINKLLEKAINKNTNLSNWVKNIDDLINAIYDLRKQAINTEGEYSIGNLVFKEIRNLGLLDKLKETKDKLTERQLTLESLNENLLRKQLENYKIKISQLVHTQPIIQQNGYFFIYNIPENETSTILNILNKQAFIEYARRGAAGRYDFSHINPIKGPQKLYTIEGKIKDFN